MMHLPGSEATHTLLPPLPLSALPDAAPHQTQTWGDRARGFLGRLYSRIPDRQAECLVVTTPHPEGGNAGAAITWWSCVGNTAISLTFEERERDGDTGAHTLDIIRANFDAYQNGLADGSNPTPVEIGVHYMRASRQGARTTNLFGTVSGQSHKTGKVEELGAATMGFDETRLAAAAKEFPNSDFKTPRLLDARESAIFVVTGIEKPDPNSKKVTVLGQLAVAPQVNGNGGRRLYYSGKRWLFGTQRRHYRSASRWPLLGFSAEFPV